MRRVRPIFIGIAVGSVLWLCTEVFSIYWFPPKSLPQQLVFAFFYPEFLVVLGLTNWLSPRFGAASTSYWQIVHPAYCIFVGGLGGIAISGFQRLSRKRGGK